MKPVEALRLPPSQPVFHLGDDFILRADILLVVGEWLLADLNHCPQS